QSGVVKVFGSTWTAFPDVGELPLIEGERVEVVRVQGSSLYVRRIDDGLPSWRQSAILPDENE
ncbi:MAG: NfeD family protein, partial [Pyrinomonadaceae bacterium]|nr:NfeD family protein [Pyrinomonadaceae bacterium]